MATQISTQDRMMALRLMLEETYIRAATLEVQRDRALAEVERLKKRPLLIRLGLRKDDRAEAVPRPQRPSPLKTGE